MNPEVVNHITGIPGFAIYFILGIALLTVFAAIYALLTPHHEFKLIRENNVAAATALAGALLGFSLPLCSAISHSVSLLDCLVWASIALLVQTLTFVGLRLIFSDLPKRIANNELAFGIFTAALSVAVGLINAAAMTD